MSAEAHANGLADLADDLRVMSKFGRAETTSGVAGRVMPERPIRTEGHDQFDGGHTSLGVADALRVVARHHECAVIDTDFDDEQAYRAALRQVRSVFSSSALDEGRLADAVAERVAGRLAVRDEDGAKRRRHRSLVGSGPVPGDAYVDQWSDLLPHDVFLRLAAEGRFASVRHGQRIMARWADVQAAIKLLGEEQRTDRRDPMDELRSKLGLLPKGGR